MRLLLIALLGLTQSAHGQYGFSQGIARNASESAYPNLWRGLVGHWCPSAGCTGQRLVDFARGNDALLVNGPKWSAGRRGLSLAFDGVDDYAVSSAFNGLRGDGTTVCCWVRAASAASGVEIVSQYATTPSSGVRAFEMWLPGAGVMEFYVYTSGGLASSRRSSVAVADGSWRHVAVIHVSGARMDIYVDGKLANGALSGAIPVWSITSTPIWIGAYNNGSVGSPTPSGLLSGAIDDIRIYNRALSPAEIMQSYMGANPLTRKEDTKR